MSETLERPQKVGKPAGQAQAYTIFEWFRTHQRRPGPAFVTPAMLRLWLSRDELQLGYIALWANGQLLRLLPLSEVSPSSPDARWIDVKIALSAADLEVAAAATCNAGQISVFLGRPAYFIASCQVPRAAEVDPVDLERLRDAACHREWNVSYVFVDGSKVLVAGWAVSADWRQTPTVVLNGVGAVVEKVRSAFAHDRYWFLPGSDWFGFHAVADLKEAADWLKMEVGGTPEGSRFPRWQRLAPASALGNIPSQDSIHRVSGPGASKNYYLNTGYTEFDTITSIFAKHGLELADPKTRILDWGCGCGRVTRHMLGLPEGHDRVVGIDIDAENIKWCDENLNASSFSVVGLDPPTPFASETFDAVFAVSVLSHLREADAHAWLAEISRILRPGGIALLTFNGSPSGAIHLSKVPGQFASLLATGFVDFRRSDNLDAFISDREYYRFVFFSDAHAAATFRQHFELVDIEPCCLAGGQSAAVLRKRG